MPYHTLNAEDIQAWLIAKIAEELNFDSEEINIEEPFARYGLNSMTAVSLSADLEDWLKIKLPATLAWDYPTIEALSKCLENKISDLA